MKGSDIMMEKDSNVNLRMNGDLKEEVKGILEDVGLDISTAVLLYFKQIVRHKGIPFEINNKDLPKSKLEKTQAQNIRLKKYFDELRNR